MKGTRNKKNSTWKRKGDARLLLGVFGSETIRRKKIIHKTIQHITLPMKIT